MRLAIRFSGAGGQGVVLAGLVLAEAAVAEGRRVACAQAYGPASRGGASRSDVVISDTRVAYPVARVADVLVALTTEAWTRWSGAVADGGVAIVDADRVAITGTGQVRIHAIPVTEAARRASGTTRPANMVAVGVAAALCDVVRLPTLEAVVRSRLSAAAVPNLKALAAGWQLGTALRQTSAPAVPVCATAAGQHPDDTR
ncbi:MAG: 2-oxoacid:acceptor oxidoreductase family protein [Armatimonadota bacterium]|nr:2-oxoacid:acceptor oxidoreductase family protein [Armatimonadota bacterium]MDR7486026.1 2-oxoacid:acceptor oxidoreductase family protein [Armatimonadota bacterium]MDR7532597.1 2-oxoacid:acceptor oxidoreductase family protein [Armatimonadota bacterium]MDR7536194.1 2-oxoacid:acceptor oxidoreductase family protein [Armatimonadota bacterium]